MPGTIAVVGSSNTDMIITLDHIPRPGETILGGDFSTAAGGKGANQAVAAARAGSTVHFIARVGTDMFGDRALGGFERDGIVTDHVIRDTGAPSGVALIFVDTAGENSIAVASGANANLSPNDIRNAADVIAASDYLVMQLEIPVATVEAAAAVAADNDVPVILNPAPAQELSDELLAKVAILTPNESEAELLTGVAVTDEFAAERAAVALMDRGVGSVIITMGAQGVYVAAPDCTRLMPGHSVTAVDTTAAGDVFNGALASALAEGGELIEAVAFAQAAAAISVTRPGAQPSAPTREEIEGFGGE